MAHTSVMRQNAPVIQVGVVYVDVMCISRHLEDELTWATGNGSGYDTIKNSYITKELKNKVVLSLKQYCSYSYIAMLSLVTYSKMNLYLGRL